MEELVRVIQDFAGVVSNHWAFVLIGIVATRFSPIIFGVINGKVKADKELQNTLESHLKRLKEEDEEQARQITELEKENARKEAKLQILTELLAGKLPDLDEIVEQMNEKISDNIETSNKQDDIVAEISQDDSINFENNIVSETSETHFTA